MTKVTITKANGTGTLTKQSDGTWSIELNGKQGAAYYTEDQVKAIIAKATATGDKVEVI